MLPTFDKLMCFYLQIFLKPGREISQNYPEHYFSINFRN